MSELEDILMESEDSDVADWLRNKGWLVYSSSDQIPDNIIEEAMVDYDGFQLVEFKHSLAALYLKKISGQDITHEVWELILNAANRIV